jgi:glycosyltransferase involved in cell wall biosynthesis
MHAALAHQLANRLDKAEWLYRQALTLSPDETDCLHMLGVVCLQNGRYPEAAELILQALKLTNWKFGAMSQNLVLVLDRLWDDTVLWDDDRRQNLERWFMEHAILTHCMTSELPPLSMLRGKDAPEGTSPLPRAQVLVVDFSMPRSDRDSGSLRMESILRLWRRMGCSVAFLPLNMDHPGANTSWLEQEGVEILNWPMALGMAQVLASRGHEFDVIFISRYKVALPYIAWLRQFAPQALFVFDTVDLHCLREQREAEISCDPEITRQAALTRKHELEVIREADVTLVVSDFEQSLLSRETPQAQVLILSNIHEMRWRQAGFGERRDIFFIGGFSHAPNVDAVRWYVAEVWPHVRRQLPNVCTYLIGSNMPDEVVALDGNGIVSVGYTPDLSPYLDGCRVSVAPLRFGAGVKGKINTAHSSGVPVIATSLAAEGMHLEDGRNVLLADSGQDFAAAIIRLYGNEGLWNTLSDGGLENVAKHFLPTPRKSRLNDCCKWR